MILPKQYMKLSVEQRSAFIQDIGFAFSKLDKNRYPFIFKNIERDEARIQLLERIINETFSRSVNPTMEQIFNKIELSLES